VNNNQRLALSGLAVCLLSAGFAQTASANVVTEWNALALSCIPRGGPATAFDVALMQAAVHDAVQAIEQRYEPYFSTPPVSGKPSKAVAAAAAAYRVLSDDRVCPNSFQPTFDAAFAAYENSGDDGLAVGYAAADVLLATEYRAPSSATTSGMVAIGQWRPTPPGNQNMAFLYAATTKPFVMSSPSQFRPGPPPAMTSPQYLKDYNEVKQKGAIGSHPTVGCPAPANTDMARFWAGNFGAQWNQVLRDAAIDRQLGIGDTARLLALANLAAADAGIGVWDSKVVYNFWRPITAIQEGDADPNPNTEGDTDWMPFIQSPQLASQTPPYPEYLSGANGVTGAYTTMMQLFFHTDHLPMAVHKAPVGGVNVPICTTPRLYRRISDAAEEVVDARVYLGIHFRFADTGARVLGTRVAWHVFANALRPKHPGWNANWKD
jgi:hypothetical protein